MFDECDTHKECIEMDIDWVKDELRGLTKAQRRIILQKYADMVQDYGIGMKEYKAFMKAFDELEEEE